MHLKFLPLALILTASSAAYTQPLYDLVITNAQIVSPEIDHGRYLEQDALAIRGTVIALLGKSSDLAASCVSPCRLINANRKFVYPGFNDGHIHAESGGVSLFRVNVSGSSTASIVQTVKAYAQSHPQLTWIVGRGWDAAGFGTRMPTRYDLDAADSQRPVVLSDSDGHQIWANSAAIVASGVTKDTPDPRGGRILRDANGEPSGIFQESATHLISGHIPHRAEDEIRSYLLKAQEISVPSGITTIQGGGMGIDSMRMFAKLESEGLLKQRVGIWANLQASDHEFEDVVAFARSLKPDSLVRVTAFKGFVDGVISSYTAAMLAPYADNASTKGYLSIEADQLNQLVLRANRAGFPAAMHAIGDRAVRVSLDAVEYSRAQLPNGPLNRIEHIETLDPADAPRFAKLNVLASMQPLHYYFGSLADSYYPTRVGPQRAAYTFAWRTLLDQKATLVFGSDYPVVGLDPMIGMWCAINRKMANGDAYFTEQKIDPAAALRAYTINAAMAMGWQDKLGRVQADHFADLVIADTDPRINPKPGTTPRIVIFNGKVVHEHK